MLRRARISKLLNNPKHTLQQRKDLADEMMNSVSQQDLVYKRK